MILFNYHIHTTYHFIILLVNLPLPPTITALIDLLTVVLVFWYVLVIPSYTTLPVVAMPSTCTPATNSAVPFVTAESKVLGELLNQPFTGDVLKVETAVVAADSIVSSILFFEIIEEVIDTVVLIKVAKPLPTGEVLISPVIAPTTNPCAFLVLVAGLVF